MNNEDENNFIKHSKEIFDECKKKCENIFAKSQQENPPSSFFQSLSDDTKRIACLYKCYDESNKEYKN